jgi:hypothetical protein
MFEMNSSDELKKYYYDAQNKQIRGEYSTNKE